MFGRSLPTEILDRAVALRVPVTEDVGYPAALSPYSLPVTDLELRQLRSLIEFLCIGKTFFKTWYGQKLLDAPLPWVDGAQNTLVFLKGLGEGEGWGYRRPSCYLGPRYTFDWTKPDYTPHSLVAAIDHAESICGERCEKWEAWKAEHPDLFSADAPPVDQPKAKEGLALDRPIVIAGLPFSTPDEEDHRQAEGRLVRIEPGVPVKHVFLESEPDAIDTLLASATPAERAAVEAELAALDLPNEER